MSNTANTANNKTNKTKEKINVLKPIEIKIGLDIDTKKTGWAIFKDGEYASSGRAVNEFKIDDVESDLMTDALKVWFNTHMKALGNQSKNASMLIDNIAIKLLQQLKPYYDDGGFINFKIAFELGFFGSKIGIAKLSMWVGMWISALSNFIGLVFPRCHKNAEFKVIQSQQWQLKAYGGRYDREDGKAKAMMIAKDLVPSTKTIETFDEAEAIIIAKMFDEIEDFDAYESPKKTDWKIKTKLEKELNKIQVKLDSAKDEKKVIELIAKKDSLRNQLSAIKSKYVG